MKKKVVLITEGDKIILQGHPVWVKDIDILYVNDHGQITMAKGIIRTKGGRTEPFIDTASRDAPFCPMCGGHHAPDLKDARIIFNGYSFKPPFRCICCGKEICGRQFAYGRCCAPCDMGACQHDNQAFQQSAEHPLPAWRIGPICETFQRFVEHTGGELADDKG